MQLKCQVALTKKEIFLEGFYQIELMYNHNFCERKA